MRNNACETTVTAFPSSRVTSDGPQLSIILEDHQVASAIESHSIAPQSSTCAESQELLGPRPSDPVCSTVNPYPSGSLASRVCTAV